MRQSKALGTLGKLAPTMMLLSLGWPLAPSGRCCKTLIWGGSRPITRSRKPEIFAPVPPRGKNVSCQGVGLIGLCFRGRLYRNLRISGEKMATIPMIPIGPVRTLNRSILLTERRMSGNGGDDFVCGHCGHVMLEDFDPSTVRGNPVYQCGVCENNNDLPFAASDGRHWSSR
jgi:hypothetical protein